MPRTARIAPGGMVFHVLNRGVARMQIFRDDKDYDAFRRVVEQTLRIAPVRICAYCWMPNHWHFVLWPQGDGDLSKFMQRMANMHTQRWQRAKLRVGYGHLYQGRFKSFPIENDEHFYRVVRYVERNALRAELVARAEAWRWGSLWRWLQPAEPAPALLSAWPIPRLPNWVERVNEPLTERELAAVRRSAQRGRPLGEPSWVEATAQRLGLASTLRPRGRPQVRFLNESANNES